MIDRRARSFLGEANRGTETELARRHIRVVGTFELGPNFFSDGNVIMSDRNFFKFFGPHGGSMDDDLPDIEIGAVKVLPGFKVSDVKTTFACRPAAQCCRIDQGRAGRRGNSISRQSFTGRAHLRHRNDYRVRSRDDDLVSDTLFRALGSAIPVREPDNRSDGEDGP